MPPAAPRAWDGVKPLRGRSLPEAKLLLISVLTKGATLAITTPAAKQLIGSPRSGLCLACPFFPCQAMKTNCESKQYNIYANISLIFRRNT